MNQGWIRGVGIIFWLSFGSGVGPGLDHFCIKVGSGFGSRFGSGSDQGSDDFWIRIESIWLDLRDVFAVSWAPNSFLSIFGTKSLLFIRIRDLERRPKKR